MSKSSSNHKDSVLATIETYNLIAKEYAKKTETEDRSNNPEFQKFIKLSKPSGKILDAGCGPGLDSALLLKAGFHVTSIDLSIKLLEQAKLNHPQLKTHLMDLRQLDFKPKSFDSIYARASLLHLPKKEIPQTLEGFWRVLKPGGLLFVLVKAGKKSGDTNWVSEQKSLGKPRYFSYFSASQLGNLLVRAKFQTIESYTYNGKKRSQTSRDQDWIAVFAQKNLVNQDKKFCNLSPKINA